MEPTATPGGGSQGASTLGRRPGEVEAGRGLRGGAEIEAQISGSGCGAPGLEQSSKWLLRGHRGVLTLVKGWTFILAPDSALPLALDCCLTLVVT